MRRWLIACSLMVAAAALAQTAPGPKVDPQQTLRRYLEAWAGDDTNAMYHLTTREGQRQIVFEEFNALVHSGFHSLRRPNNFGQGNPGGPGNPGGNRPGPGFGGPRRSEGPDDSFRIVHLYQPQLNGDQATVAFTLQFRDGRVERQTAFLVREGEEWRFPMHFDEPSRTWLLPPSAPTRPPAMRPGAFGPMLGTMMGGEPNRMTQVAIMLRHQAATSIMQRFGMDRFEQRSERPLATNNSSARPLSGAIGKARAPLPPKPVESLAPGPRTQPRLQIPFGIESVTPDPRTNMLIVRGAERAVNEFRMLVEALDRPLAAVELRFEIIQVTGEAPAVQGEEEAAGVQKLIAEGRARLLSSPRLTTASGATAHLLVGGSTTSQSIIATPTVLEAGAIQCEFKIECKGDHGSVSVQTVISLREGKAAVIGRSSQPASSAGQPTLVLVVTPHLRPLPAGS